MKTTLLSSFRRNYTYILTFFVLSLCLFSCKKDNTISNVVVNGGAKLKLINANANAAMDFYMDEVRLNNQQLAFGESTEYIRVSSGTRMISTSNTNYLPSQLVLVPTFSYTAFYVEDRTGKGEILALEDHLGSIELGKARIRFINTSPYFTNTVNVGLSEHGLIVNSLAFKEASDYFSVDPNEDLRVSVLGTAGVKVLSGNAFEAGKIYTIWFSGSSNANLAINKITYN